MDGAESKLIVKYMEKAIRKVIVIIFRCRIPVESVEIHTAGNIPPVANFVYGLWDEGELPEEFSRNINLWRRQGWEIRVWRRLDIDKLLNKYPEIERAYRKVERNVQRADIARYLIIYDQGGFYMDCDCSPRCFSLLRFLQRKNSLQSMFFIEDELTRRQVESRSCHPVRKIFPEIFREKISNFIFGASSGNEIIKKCLDESVRRSSMLSGMVIDDLGVLVTTGPEVTTDMVQANRFSSSVFNHQYFCMHDCTGTWRNNQCTQTAL